MPDRSDIPSLQPEFQLLVRRMMDVVVIHAKRRAVLLSGGAQRIAFRGGDGHRLLEQGRYPGIQQQGCHLEVSWRRDQNVRGIDALGFQQLGESGVGGRNAPPPSERLPFMLIRLDDRRKVLARRYRRARACISAM